MSHESTARLHLRRAKTYLDWLGKALCRHPQIKGDSSGRQPSVEAQIKLRCITEVEREQLSTDHEQQAELRQALLNLSPLPVETPPDVKEAIRERLFYRYPHPLSLVPAKLSVTEIKRRFALAAAEEDEAQRLIEQPWPRPAFMQKSISGGARLIITALQHLDLTQPVDETGIMSKCSSWRRQEFWTNFVNTDRCGKSYRFLASEAGH